MRPAMVLWLLASLSACGPGAQAPSPVAQADAAVPASTPSPTPVSTTSAADAGLAIAIAREDVDRAAREQTLRVQKRLRDQEHEWAKAREAAERGDGSERCIAGQKMRRVANGWVQAGRC
jgi:hypothetical protein